MSLQDAEAEADPEHAAALRYYKMVDARLRRLCERKKSGKIQVPDALHEAWLKGGTDRDALRALLEAADFDKAC